MAKRTKLSITDKNITRRQFLAAVSVGTSSFLLGCNTRTSPDVSLPIDPFQTVTLGKTGIKSSLVGFGTGFNGYQRQSHMTRMGKEKAISLLHYAYDMGIRFFDCADLYGTHPYMSDVLRIVPREKIVLASKIWVRKGGIPEDERPDANIVVDRFRKELNTDYIDLVQMHCMTDANWTDQQKRQMDILDNLKAKGIIRAHGVSIHSLDALKACVTSPWVDVVHTRTNAYGEAMDDKDPDVVAAVIDKIHKAGKGVIGMKLIGNGKFRNDPEKIDRSLQYVMDMGSVDSIIIGFETPEQIDDYAMRAKKVLKVKQNS